MKLIDFKSEYIEAPAKLSMDELYTEASKLGKVEIGGTFCSQTTVEIKLRCNGDLLFIKSSLPDVKESLSEAISKARKIKDFYRENFQ